jgi:predicted permease
MDGTVLAACAAVTFITALLFGAAPGLVTLRRGFGATLRQARTVASPGGRLRGALIAGEVALALSLIVGATLMTRTLIALQNVDPGFRPAGLLTARLTPTGRPPEEIVAWWDEVLDVVRATPGVESVARVMHLPMSGRTWVANYEVEGRPLAADRTPPRSAWQSASAEYFETAGIPLIRGRTLTAGDRAGSMRVMVVNEAFADVAFPGEDPVGQRVRATPATADEFATIIGVVGSVRHDSLTVEPRPEIYVAATQVRFGANSIVVRTAGDPAALAPVLRERIRALDASAVITHLMTMDALIGSTTHRRQAVLTLFAAFAGIGLVLGLVGIWGVVAFGVRERVREIGIRMALGAERRTVTGLVVRQGLTWALAGILIGWPAALALARLLEGLVFGVSTADPVTFTIIPIVLTAIAAMAAWLPARRAARVDPASVLRE